MIEYIKDYGITSLEYEYVENNLKYEALDLFKANELEVRKNLQYLQEYGVDTGLARLIVERPDLFILPIDNLKELISKVDKKIFVNVAKKSPEDLILIGV